MMGPLIFRAFVDEMEKQAVMERLIRAGFQDVPLPFGKMSPRVFMRKRSPAELAAIQQRVDDLGEKYLSGPIMNVAERGLKKLPPGRVQDTARSAAKMLAEDPLVAAALSVVPIPGTELAYFAGKRALERGIDKVFPLPPIIK